ncbi:relaxase/mobilization nuclease domain-containing protein [Pseudonocardia alni]|uniref:relaxase/mobilization nuclease domain-containing protein n=1 Tax=Pseudonocardia alni TaxID=33907 RepID=UPI0033217FA2
MITKVVHGWRVGGLIAYLMGPGRAQEHVNPRVIATWDGRDAVWQPPRSDAARSELGPLIRALRAPAVAAGLDEGGVEDKRGFVWHCSARVAVGDRVLSDSEWAEVARELLDGAGVARRDDAGGPRWVAVRHADDHIHIAVVLVRQDTCRRFWPFRDYPRLREAARGIEDRLGLTVTAAADGTAAPAPGRGEIEKARRQGREPARVELARAVREAAVASDGPAEFVTVLEGAGYLVEVRRAPSGDPLGFKVARPGDMTASGKPVFYSGSRLAPDLSLPQLVRAWAAAGQGRDLVDPVTTARRRVDAARRSVGTVRAGGVGEDPEGLASAAHTVLTAMRGASSDWADAADRFDRAARSPRGTAVREGAGAAAMRRVARQLVRHRRMLGVPVEPGAAGVALAVALVALLREIAAWQRDRGRAHQSDAALSAADLLTGVATGAATRPIEGLTIPAATPGPQIGTRRDRAPAGPSR